MMLDNDQWLDVATKNWEQAAKNYGEIIPPPGRYFYIDPMSVHFHCSYHIKTKRKYGSKLYDWGRVISGNWDLDRREKYRTDWLRGELRKRFYIGLRWEETELWQHKCQVIQAKGMIDGCKNVDQLKKRYERLDVLFHQIKGAGALLSAEERGAKVSDDLFVSVARDGCHLFAVGGSHRLAIAQVLKLERIPVRVLSRHEQCVRHQWSS
ncbi:hypothetical protein VCB98_10845 [Gammaproteobacteria bacterium AB-CW1]|uniref:ParB/Sulfiredoxin domain-containing protein n=1 Tax=Natronospira elongata TaxID=3110268 RepID=A0AAP6JH03_9GAMM|nr:hypothetical protein [Gammaproteobacteria bacterium AB-CW1]